MSGSAKQSKSSWLCGALALAALSCAAGASPEGAPVPADAAALRSAARTVASYVKSETPMVRCAACRAILRLTTQEALRE